MKMFKPFAPAPMTTMTIITLTAALLASASASSAELTVEVKGINNNMGKIYIAVYDKAEGWMKKPVHSASAAANVAGVAISLKDVAVGEYAISLYHDENDNGKMDTNIVGMPIEPYAFSNDAAGQFGPASFEQAKFKVDADKKSIVINIK